MSITFKIILSLVVILLFIMNNFFEVNIVIMGVLSLIFIIILLFGEKLFELLKKR